jgi:ssRNA-specific RNase YbeY (16S rRNA maturation enzyme)
MENNDPRESLLSLISIENSHVNLHPPKIFLFGGDMNKSNPKKTVRALLYDHLLVNNLHLFESLVLVEEFEDWLHDSIYPDLLTFESDLAETASLIVISLESPGALAELGSFSVNKKLKNKVVIIICDDHHNQKSYIKLGPLRQLKDENILSYPYKYDDLESSLPKHLDDITVSLNNILNKSQKTEKFDLTNKGHIAFLIHDLILTYKALINKEIKCYLKCLNVDIASQEVLRLLFLLEKLELIKKTRMGNTEYYLVVEDDHRIVFSNKSKSSKFDRNSATLSAFQYYKNSKKEKRRLKVLEIARGAE